MRSLPPNAALQRTRVGTSLHEELRISLWDAMIVQSARRMECRVLWTEDLNDGQRYAGVLVRNPFVDSVME